MPELLVVSDSHGSVPALTAVFAWARSRGVDALAYLGDGLDDLEPAFAASSFRPCPLARVRGNGDHGSLPAQAVLDFGGRRFFLCHGHTFGVHDGLDALVRSAALKDAHAALYGHTHVPFWDEFSGLLVLNPGSPTLPRRGAPPGFATIGCPDDGSWFVPRHWRLDGRKIKEFDHTDIW